MSDSPGGRRFFITDYLIEAGLITEDEAASLSPPPTPAPAPAAPSQPSTPSTGTRWLFSDAYRQARSAQSPPPSSGPALRTPTPASPQPPGPPQRATRELIGDDGVVRRQIPGMGGDWTPVATIGGAVLTDTTPGGAALPPSVGPRQPARDPVIGGRLATTPGGTPLHPRCPPSPFMPR